jgi:hypothetical protein
MENERQFRPAMNMSAHSAYPTLRKDREGWGTRSCFLREREKTDL